MENLKLIFASGNEHKTKEMRVLVNKYLRNCENFRDCDVDIFSLKDINCNEEIEENGKTFEENAEIKANFVYNWLKNNEYNKNNKNCIVFADDSGLCVDFLNGAPGIYSARYAESGKRKERILNELLNVAEENRGAYFYCAIYCIGLINGEESSFCVSGKCDGFITKEIKGESGFGYDPIFFSPEFNKTFGEIDGEDKNKISHRARAVENFIKELLVKL